MKFARNQITLKAAPHHLCRVCLWSLMSCALLLSARGLAWALSVPSLDGPVVDQAGLLSLEQRQALDHKLRQYQRQHGHQFALLTVATLKDEALEDFTMRVVESWQLGDKKADNGLLFFIAKDERRMRIEVGYGLEGVIPDVLAGRVIREVVQPAFRAGDFYGGIDRAFGVLMRAGTGEKVALANKGKGRGPIWPLFFVGGVFFLSMFLGRRGRRGRGYFPGAGLGGFGGGGFGGGFGGGGFSGGGGGFGGGGASGGW